MNSDRLARNRTIFSIFRDMRACDSGGGRLLFEDIEAEWVERGHPRDELIFGLQVLVDDGLLELQEIGRDSVFSVTEKGFDYAKTLWNPVKTISGLAGYLIRRAQRQQQIDIARIAQSA